MPKTLKSRAGKFHRIYIVLGYAGSGKSTDADVLSNEVEYELRLQNNDVPIISSGQLARQFWENRRYWTQLAPEEGMRSIIYDNLTQILKGGYDHVILDGFPRNSEQLEWLMTHFEFDIIEFKYTKAGFWKSFNQFVLRGRKNDTLLKFISDAVRYRKFKNYLINLPNYQYDQLYFKD